MDWVVKKIWGGGQGVGFFHAACRGSIRHCAILQSSNCRLFLTPHWIRRVQEIHWNKVGASSMQGVLVGCGWLFLLLCPNSNAFDATLIWCHSFSLDPSIWVLSSHCNCPIDQPIEASPALLEQVCVGMQVYTCSRLRPLEILVVSFQLFHHICWLSIVVGCSMVPCKWLGFVHFFSEGKGEGVSKNIIAWNQFQQKFWLARGSFVIPKTQCFEQIGNPVFFGNGHCWLLWAKLKQILQASPEGVVLEEGKKNFTFSEFRTITQGDFVWTSNACLKSKLKLLGQGFFSQQLLWSSQRQIVWCTHGWVTK